MTRVPSCRAVTRPVSLSTCRCAETVLKRLELPYRTIVLCTGDMGFSAILGVALDITDPDPAIHGTADILISSEVMEHVVGEQEQVSAICIGPHDDMEVRRADIRAAIDRVDDGSGVIMLTDLFGGTPSNLAISLLESGRVDVIAGVNLPMLIRLEGARKSMNVRAAVAAAREAGRKYISVASEILGEAAA